MNFNNAKISAEHETVSAKANPETNQLQLACEELTTRVDVLRRNASNSLEADQRAEMGQFLTPEPIARLMASLMQCSHPVVSILDAGAGTGSLFAACVASLCQTNTGIQAIHVTAYEIDPLLLTSLEKTAAMCHALCEQAGIIFCINVRPKDFIKEVADQSSKSLFAAILPRFDVAILNPPYRKIHITSSTRIDLRRIGIETSNLYAGFLAAAMQLLAPNGELIAITPRSFCNGVYFRPFRKLFLNEMALTHLHLFDSREENFHEDAILQETLILRATRSKQKPERICVTTSKNAADDSVLVREMLYSEIVYPNDPEQFIRIVPDGISQQIVDRMARFTTRLEVLGLTVSTGRVVDFRAKEYLCAQPTPKTVPLLYPVNIERGRVVWPQATHKPQALIACKQTDALLVPNENYVLVKRFTSKEQTRRVVAAVFSGGEFSGNAIGLENHLNYFHQAGRGMALCVAKGLAVYLNSTLVDAFFRQFSGHTQVNATDLRNLHYPTLFELSSLGAKITEDYPTQDKIDALIESEFFGMAEIDHSDPVAAQRRIKQATDILKALGLPKAQQNERSALTLLALLELNASRSWSEAANPLLGITPMMEFMEQQYGKKYAPNTRETVRRQTVHQFQDAGLIVSNPDEPTRPINSGKTVYQIETSALELLRTYETEEWEQSLETYLASVETLKARYAQERERLRIPLEIAPGQTISLSPGGQNVLVEQIIQNFGQFTHGGKPIYVGDTDDKFAFFDAEYLQRLGVQLDKHDKMPDVIIHDTSKNWLFLIEAVTSHGPINPKRKAELQVRFGGSTAGLVFVTAFLDRRAMMRELPNIAWETEVWVADAPNHMIHFNGERFLGPY